MVAVGRTREGVGAGQRAYQGRPEDAIQGDREA